jgi:hypothetical protein
MMVDVPQQVGRKMSNVIAPHPEPPGGEEPALLRQKTQRRILGVDHPDTLAT